MAEQSFLKFVALKIKELSKSRVIYWKCKPNIDGQAFAQVKTTQPDMVLAEIYDSTQIDGELTVVNAFTFDLEKHLIDWSKEFKEKYSAEKLKIIIIHSDKSANADGVYSSPHLTVI